MSHAHMLGWKHGSLGLPYKEDSSFSRSESVAYAAAYAEAEMQTS